MHAAAAGKDSAMKGLRMDAPVLLGVWILCVTTDWSTGTKATLNVAAVAGLCLKEYLVHRRLQRIAVRIPRAAAGAAGAARRPAFAAA